MTDGRVSRITLGGTLVFEIAEIVGIAVTGISRERRLGRDSVIPLAYHLYVMDLREDSDYLGCLKRSDPAGLSEGYVKQGRIEAFHPRFMRVGVVMDFQRIE